MTARVFRDRDANQAPRQPDPDRALVVLQLAHAKAALAQAWADEARKQATK